MRKIYPLILLFLCLNVFSQTKNYYYNSWRLGLNLGGMWQTSDLNKNPAGFAGGFTLEKGILENKSHFFSLAIRGRLLFGNTYGFSSKKNYNVSANPALNGTYNPSVNYADTAGGAKFVYNNYKTQISEGSLELQISFNELRERTHVILNLWGGVGFSAYRTNTNLLDADGKMYNFSKIDSTGSSSNIIGSQKSFMDRSYESYAERSKNGNIFTFSPSAGIGLGYQFSQAFSMIFEYKVTFPQGMNADLLDGHAGINNHWAGKNNDFYHYAGVNFLFTLGGGHKTKDSTHHVANTTTNTNNTQNTNNQVGVTSGNTNPAFSKPTVTITNPGYSPYNSNTNTFEVKAKVYNVSSRSQLAVDFNGGSVSNYNFSGNDLSFNVNLLSGNNNVVITASNQGRSDTKSAIINYVGNPPVINLSNPLSNPFNTSSAALNISASILNIASSGDLLVKFNGSIVNTFSYNSQNDQFSIPLNLVLGNNTFEITASNNFGQDIKTISIVYTKQVEVGNTTSGNKLGLTITDPAVSNITIKTNTYNVKAKAEGASSSSQIAVTVNGVNTTFNFDANTGMITFDAPLISGANPIVVSVKSGKSSTSKSTSINYETFVGENGSKSKVICYSKDKINFQTLTILQSEWPAYQALGAYEGPCKDKKFGEEGANTDPEIVICHISVSGKKQTINILQSQWAAHQAHGDILGECPKLSAEVGEAEADKVIVICHKNEDGSKQTINIMQSKWAEHLAHGDILGACPLNTGEGGGMDQDPIITICHRKVNGSKQTITIRQSQWISHQSHGDILGACVAAGEEGGGIDKDPEITICHKNERLSQTMVILQSQWAQHKAHGDELGACPGGNPEGGNSDDGIKICHKNNDGSKQTLVVSASAWPAHQAHGDVLGECAVGTPTLGGSQQTIKICHKGENNIWQTMDVLQNQWASHQAHGDHLGSCSNLELGIDIVICHIPPGNPNNPQTLTISQNAWPAHQAHGDYLGTCAEGKIIKGGNTEGETSEPKKEPEQKTEGGQSAPRTIKGEVNKEETGKTEPKTDAGETGRTLKPR